jgi:hypothetical protein
MSPAAYAGVAALMTRYAACADRVPGAGAWADCFVEDAVVWTYSPRPGREPSVLAGCATIEKAFLVAAVAFATTHITANIVIDDGEAPHVVNARSAFVRFDHLAAGSTVVGSFGRYRDQVRHCEDGLWRLAERQIHLLSRRAPRVPPTPWQQGGGGS